MPTLVAGMAPVPDSFRNRDYLAGGNGFGASGAAGAAVGFPCGAAGCGHALTE